GRLRALAELKIHPRDTLGNRTLMARAERVYQQLRGELREWLGGEILLLQRALATRDTCAIVPVRRQLEAQLDRIEREGYVLDGGCRWQRGRRRKLPPPFCWCWAWTPAWTPTRARSGARTRGN